MKNCFFTAIVAMAMLAVSCNVDPFLGNVKSDNKKKNKANFEVFTNTLQNSCYTQSGYYKKASDKWELIRKKDMDGCGVTRCFMTDSGTLIQYIEFDYKPGNNVRVTEYSIDYDPNTATITTTEILPDGTTGEICCSRLLAAKPIVVIEGPFAGDRLYQYVAHELVEVPVRWCFEEFDREEAMKDYETWLSEQQ